MSLSIDNIATSTLTASGSRPLPKAASPARIHDAAQQFESLLIGELLKTAHGASGSGWLGTDEEESGQTGVGFGEEQFARMLASSGGLGLSSMIEKGLKSDAAKVAAANG